MKIWLDKEIVELYEKHEINFNDLFLDLLSVLRLKYTNELNFSFVKPRSEIDSVEVELSDDVENLLVKCFPQEMNFDQVANLLASFGLMLGGDVL